MTARTKITAAVVAALLIGLGVVLALNSNGSSGEDDTDGAFVSQMIPHHESAIEMAQIAQERGQHPEIRQLAADITSSQGSEIQTLEGIYERLYGEPADGQHHGDMGMDESMMGMDMDMDSLETAQPFDREFIDQMIAHHQGAIRMAQAQLQDGKDQEARDLAMAIIDAQTAEIEQMNAWRTEWYGAASPSGGVPGPDETDESDEHAGMGH